MTTMRSFFSDMLRVEFSPGGESWSQPVKCSHVRRVFAWVEPRFVVHVRLVHETPQ